MAKEWYLLKSPHDQVSGFESDALNDFGAEGFLEALDSDMAVDAELYNYDLSECTPIRAIFSNRLTDTKLKSLVRHLLVPIGLCHAGMYAKVKGRFWLIVSIVDDNGVYEKAILSICNYVLSWLNKDGDPVQRWTNIISASQYNNGEHENLNYTIRSDQLLISLPDDDESLMLEQNMRFVIDKRCKLYERDFSDDTVAITGKPVNTYELTRVDSILYDYQDSGLHQIMVTQDEQHKDDGYYVIDGKGYWLCEAPRLSQSTKESPRCSIDYEDAVIYNDIEPAAFIARFYDGNGTEIKGVSPEWNISGDFAELLDITYMDNDIVISANNKKLINKEFVLTLRADGYLEDSLNVAVRTFM